jgi:excisionase family DNA binding protein
MTSLAHEVAPSTILDSHGAAAHLLLDETTITRWARKGYIPAHPLGEGKRKSWRFYKHELDDWLLGSNNQEKVSQ